MRKRKTAEEGGPSNQERIKTSRKKENYKYLENSGSGHHQTSRDERKR